MPPHLDKARPPSEKHGNRQRGARRRLRQLAQRTLVATRSGSSFFSNCEVPQHRPYAVARGGERGASDIEALELILEALQHHHLRRASITACLTQPQCVSVIMGRGRSGLTGTLGARYPCRNQRAVAVPVVAVPDPRPLVIHLLCGEESVTRGIRGTRPRERRKKLRCNHPALGAQRFVTAKQAQWGTPTQNRHARVQTRT